MSTEEEMLIMIDENLVYEITTKVNAKMEVIEELFDSFEADYTESSEGLKLTPGQVKVCIETYIETQEQKRRIVEEKNKAVESSNHHFESIPYGPKCDCAACLKYYEKFNEENNSKFDEHVIVGRINLKYNPELL